MHPDAIKIIRYINSNKSIVNVVIATNGTIVPVDEVLKEIKNSKISLIRISNYNCVAIEKIEKLKNKLDAFNIAYLTYHFTGGESVWADCGGVDLPRLDHYTVKEQFKACGFKGCLTLENGFVSRCSRATVAHFIQKFEITKHDGVNVRNSFNDKDIITFAYGNYPVSACYYCQGTNLKKIPAAEQMTLEEVKKLQAVRNEI